MALGASLLMMGLSASGLYLSGLGDPTLVTDTLQALAVLSTFAAICTAEARFAS